MANTERNSSNSKKKTTKTPKQKLLSTLKGMAVYILIAIALLIFVTEISGGVKLGDEIALSQVINDVRDGKVQKLEVEGDRINVSYKEADKKAYTRKEPNASVYEILSYAKIDSNAVPIEIKDPTLQQALMGILGAVLPFALMIGVFFFLFRRAQESGQGIFSFGQSRARIFNKDQPQIKFADVAGVDEAKRELQEIVEFLKTPDKFKALGAKIPKGVLLVGPAGTGKTLLSRAVAGEAGVPFFSIAGSEFMEMLVGVGAARVRDMFGQAKKASPAIIFIDEVESIGRMRGSGVSGGHDEREQTLNQILVEMDGFTPTDHVIIIAATNRPDMLDPALVRPGRFDRRVTLGLPDLEERKAIIQLHMTGKPLTKDVNFERLARRTVGFSGADIANMLNEAAILAAREGKTAIDNKDFEEAATKVKLGPQRKRMASEQDRKLAAYHEAGHAVVAHFLPHMDPVHRISIVARGMSGGHTLYPPTEDRTNESKSRLTELITTAMGGQAAEVMFLDDVSTGAASDLSMATKIARAMVLEYGMSQLGPINVSTPTVFGAWRGLEEDTSLSPEFHAQVDREVKRLLDVGYKQAVELINQHKTLIDKVAKTLLDKETLDNDEFEKLVGKKSNGLAPKIAVKRSPKSITPVA